MAKNETYDAGSISVLVGLVAVRMRPGMYIGSVSTKGLNHLIYEIVDNTLCEYDLDKLYLDNEDNLLGQFIDRFAEADDEISKRALKYGVEAILATGDK